MTTLSGMSTTIGNPTASLLTTTDAMGAATTTTHSSYVTTATCGYWVTTLTDDGRDPTTTSASEAPHDHGSTMCLFDGSRDAGGDDERMEDKKDMKKTPPPKRRKSQPPTLSRLLNMDAGKHERTSSHERSLKATAGCAPAGATLTKMNSHPHLVTSTRSLRRTGSNRSVDKKQEVAAKTAMTYFMPVQTRRSHDIFLGGFVRDKSKRGRNR